MGMQCRDWCSWRTLMGYLFAALGKARRAYQCTVESHVCTALLWVNKISMFPRWLNQPDVFLWHSENKQACEKILREKIIISSKSFLPLAWILINFSNFILGSIKQLIADAKLYELTWWNLFCFFLIVLRIFSVLQ